MADDGRKFKFPSQWLPPETVEYFKKLGAQGSPKHWADELQRRIDELQRQIDELQRQKDVLRERRDFALRLTRSPLLPAGEASAPPAKQTPVSPVGETAHQSGQARQNAPSLELPAQSEMAESEPAESVQSEPVKKPHVRPKRKRKRDAIKLEYALSLLNLAKYDMSLGVDKAYATVTAYVEAEQKEGRKIAGVTKSTLRRALAGRKSLAKKDQPPT